MKQLLLRAWFINNYIDELLTGIEFDSLYQLISNLRLLNDFLKKDI